MSYLPGSGTQPREVPDPAMTRVGTSTRASLLSGTGKPGGEGILKALGPAEG